MPDPIPTGQEWHVPKPESIPPPTYCPVMLAVGVLLLAWGPLASGMLSVAGAAIFIIGATWWINELRHDRESS